MNLDDMPEDDVIRGSDGAMASMPLPQLILNGEPAIFIKSVFDSTFKDKGTGLRSVVSNNLSFAISQEGRQNESFLSCCYYPDLDGVSNNEATINIQLDPSIIKALDETVLDNRILSSLGIGIIQQVGELERRYDRGIKLRAAVVVVNYYDNERTCKAVGELLYRIFPNKEFQELEAEYSEDIVKYKFIEINPT